MSYNKPPRTYAEQLDILKTRGLIVGDAGFALHCLEHCNYYRISAYRFPLTVKLRNAQVFASFPLKASPTGATR